MTCNACAPLWMHRRRSSSSSVDATSARLADDTLAGSIVTMDQALQRYRESTGATWPELVQMTSRNAATLLDEPTGQLAIGDPADVTVLDRTTGSVLATVIAGEVLYQAAD